MAQTTGRRPSERTLVIRKALDENPELTWSQIVERGVFPAALGVTQRNFDATKHLWQKQQAKAIRVRKIRKAIKANPDLTYQQAVEDEVFKPELGVTEDLFNAVKAKLNGDQPRRTNGTRSATPAAPSARSRRPPTSSPSGTSVRPSSSFGPTAGSRRSRRRSPPTRRSRPSTTR